MFTAWEHSIINISILLNFIHRIRIIPTKSRPVLLGGGEQLDKLILKLILSGNGYKTAKAILGKNKTRNT